MFLTTSVELKRRVLAALPWVVFAGILAQSDRVFGEERSVEVGASQAQVGIVARSAEDVRQIIHELASVRDYERLRWILDAIEYQVPPVRAELLNELDAQIQELFQAEVEVRMATALSSLQPGLSLSGFGLDQTQGTAQPLEETTWDAGEPTSDRASWAPTRTYHDVQQQIEQAEFTGDPHERMERIKTLSRMIMGVEDHEQRRELSRLLRERSRNVFFDELKAPEATVSGAIPALPGNASD